MTSRPRFPVGLTLAAAIVVAICSGLGVWQLQRLDWKNHQLARIAALQHAPPQPIGPVLVRGARGEDVSFTRVTADCAAGPPTPAQFRLTSDNGEWIARAMAPCRLPGLPYDGVVVDRGFLKASRGATAPPTGVVLPPPAQVVGELFPSKALSGGLAHPAPLVLAAELETPAPPGIAPAPYAGGAANLEYVGAYAPTWFGLAGAAALVYAAMLWRRTHPKPTSPR